MLKGRVLHEDVLGESDLISEVSKCIRSFIRVSTVHQKLSFDFSYCCCKFFSDNYLSDGTNKLLTPVTIAQIIGLHKADLQTREIVVNVGVSERSVRNWVKHFKDKSVELLSAKP